PVVANRSGYSSKSSLFGAASPVKTKSAARTCSPRFKRSETVGPDALLPLSLSTMVAEDPSGLEIAFAQTAAALNPLLKRIWYDLVSTPLFFVFLSAHARRTWVGNRSSHFPGQAEDRQIIFRQSDDEIVIASDVSLHWDLLLDG